MGASSGLKRAPVCELDLDGPLTRHEFTTFVPHVPAQRDDRRGCLLADERSRWRRLRTAMQSAEFA